MNIAYKCKGLKNCAHARFHVGTVYAKALQHTQKNGHANFEIPLISKILERYFTELFCNCLTENFFCSLFSVLWRHMFALKYCTKLDRFKFVNSPVISKFPFKLQVT